MSKKTNDAVSKLSKPAAAKSTAKPRNRKTAAERAALSNPATPSTAPGEAAPAAAEKVSEGAEFSGAPESGEVTSPSSNEPQHGNPAEPAAHQPVDPARSQNDMDQITLVRSTATRKDARLVIYNIEGRKGSVQFLGSLFEGGAAGAPERLTLNSDVSFAQPRVAKPKETPEERKARLAALPKPTIEQQIAKAEEKARKLREKLERQAAKANTGGGDQGAATETAAQ